MGVAAFLLALSSCATPTDDADAESRYQQARQHFVSRRWAEAAPLYERVIGKRPMLRDAYHDLGRCYEELARDSEAIRIYERAIGNSDSRDDIALRRLAELQVRKEMFEAAIATYRKLDQVTPGPELTREIARLEAVKRSQEEQAEKGRLARAAAKYDEMCALLDQLLKGRKYAEALSIIDGYPQEFRDTEWWKIKLRDRKVEIRNLMESSK